MSAVLEQTDLDLFSRLYSTLLCFVNSQAEILHPKTLSPDEFLDLPVQERIKVRDALYKQKRYIDQFMKSENAKEFNSEELAIIESWKHFIKGRFFIYKHLKKHSIFLDDSSDQEKAYAVSGLFDSMEAMFPAPPVLVETVLIPFKDRIIYDEFLMRYSIYFGSGIRNRLKDCYEEAKHHFGLITQLPIQLESGRENDDVEKLKFYMKNKSNRDNYWDEIVTLSLKSKELTNVFYQEMGKTNALYFSKQLKRVGLEKKWFGIIDNTVIASGVSKDQLEKNIKEVVPSDKVGRVYIFKT